MTWFSEGNPARDSLALERFLQSRDGKKWLMFPQRYGRSAVADLAMSDPNPPRLRDAVEFDGGVFVCWNCRQPHPGNGKACATCFPQTNTPTENPKSS